MGQINYKDKYLQLRARFEESIDVSFRLGFEQGAQAAQQQQMQQQAQQVADQQAQAAQLAAGGQPGAPGQEAQPEQDPSQPSQPSQPGAQLQEDSRGVGQQTGAAGAPQGMGGSELDQHIGELEGLMAKSEYGTPEWETLNKSIDKLKSIKVSMDFSKGQDLIKSIGRNLNRPLNISGRAKHNLTVPAKNALGLQHKIVNDLMDTWSREEAGLPTAVSAILASENLTKKE